MGNTEKPLKSLVFSLDTKTSVYIIRHCSRSKVQTSVRAFRSDALLHTPETNQDIMGVGRESAHVMNDGSSMGRGHEGNGKRGEETKSDIDGKQ